ncbi:hypothetical protein [Natronorubrum halophilum]|uniref:hypothetical protein n=1 Tax=Natronorubrum halophilum TaxID=1702106 RepID=UPI0010C1D613|nr:hypothetical protein [Natronorubrum halophilum]
MSRGPDRDSGRDGRSRNSALTSASDQLKGGFVALVGFSGGMIALQGGASPVVIGLAVVGGLVAGVALLWYVLRIAE